MTYAELNNYNLLSKFKNTNDFNNQFEQIMLDAKELFTKSEYIALNKLRKFANEVIGVAWCKLQTSVKATFTNDFNGVSRSTFDRMLRKAKAINLITVIPQYKKNGYKKHNVYVFNRIEDVQIDRIVSDLRTIDVSENVKIDATRTNNLSELLRIKQVNNINRKMAYKKVEESKREEQKERITREQLLVYTDNPFQIALFDAINGLPYDNSIQDVKGLLSLRMGSDATQQTFIKAKKIVHSIAMQMLDGHKFNNIVATFSAALKKSMQYDVPAHKKLPHYNWLHEGDRSRKVPFYDWLTERE